MTNQWKSLKSIISEFKLKEDLFLSLIDEKGNIVCVNSNMQRSLQLENPRLVPANFFSLLHPEHVPILKKAIDHSRQGTPYSTELYIKNGCYHPMKWQVNYLGNQEKNGSSYLCIGYKLLDVDTGLNQSDAVLRAFMHQTPNLTWVIDEDGTLLSASAAFFSYFGLKEEQSVNRNIVELVPRLVADALRNNHLKVIEHGRPVESVEKVKWADGSSFAFHVNVFPINGMPGKKMIAGHAANITDKYAVEKKLREANERLLLLSRATTDAIWEWDMQTGHIFRNDSLMDMIGYQPDNAKGLSWWLRRIHPEDRNRVTDKIKEATDNGHHSWDDEYRFKCADGTYKHIQDHGYVVYENGLPIKMIGSLQDVSEVKKLQDLLTEEKLQRQKEVSEMVIRVQEKERTRIGHELHDNVNQILSTTRMFVQMLTPSTEEEKHIKERSLEYLLTSIEEIRKLSKELVVPHFKEKGLVESIYSLIEDIQLSSSLRIRFIHDHENDLLSPGKKIAIFRIVQEQLKNILKYSKATQVDICLHCRNENAQLVIKDDGIGFDPKQSQKGIGLSNIHDRTRYYNGSVEIDSSPGKGCILTVTIPWLN